jgi:hypothetical protein
MGRDQFCERPGKPGSLLTRRWRKPDSNPLSLSARTGRSGTRHIGFRIIGPAQAGARPWRGTTGSNPPSSTAEFIANSVPGRHRTSSCRSCMRVAMRDRRGSPLRPSLDHHHPSCVADGSRSRLSRNALRSSDALCPAISWATASPLAAECLKPCPEHAEAK